MESVLTGQPSTHVDVLIVGAGISGIGAACHLQQQCPGKQFLILEAQESFGGTWLTHRYPGIRSDSDLFTFGYRFKPWLGAPIASREEILSYLGEVIQEHGLEPHLHYRHRIVDAAWSSQEQRWTLRVAVSDGREEGDAQTRVVTTHFLWMCQGYYRHAQGYIPEWPGTAQFEGEIIHPQHWPSALNLHDKKVVVIGSGASAATIVPAIAGHCQHVTMLQRSPTYFITGRNANELAQTLRALDIPASWTHEIVRRKVLFDQKAFQTRCETEPEQVAEELLNGVRQALGDAHAHLVAEHFTPTYRPWRQRIAFVPEADLFKAIRENLASVVTGEIASFTAGGLELKSGQVVPADIVVSATGFNLNVMGDIKFSIDGKPLDFAETVTYQGAMFTGVPNLVWVFGYLRASWTLRTDLLGDFVCRLLNRMTEHGHGVVVPKLREAEESMLLGPWIDPENFNPGYLTRGVHLLPKQGEHSPWLHTQNYALEKDALPAVDLNDGALQFVQVVVSVE
jgi:cation diffusion facilitator CzcD-associated flavoprotein CzcO